MKKDQNSPNKTFTVTINQENQSLITIIPLDNNHLTEITIAVDLQIKEIHEISHKIDIVDQTVETINIEITIQDQNQTEVITQNTTEIVQIQTPELDIIRTIVLEILHLTVTETAKTIGIDNFQITDHETIQTKDQTKILSN